MQGVRYTPYDRNSLITAVRERTIQRVREIISSRGLSYKKMDTYDLLCTAVEQQHTEIAKLLLTNGSKVNNENSSSSNTPIHFAALNGDVEIVRMLLDRGANINAENLSGKTALHNAVESMSMEIIGMLLSQGANVDAADRSSVTPLHLAVINDSKEITNLLLSRGANVDGTTSGCSAVNMWESYTPLHFAVDKGNEEITELLLSKSANVNAEAEYGTTSLHLATQIGHLESVEHLLNCGANVNAVYNSANKEAYAALDVAAEDGDQDVIELLLNFVASVDTTDGYGLTAFHIAAKEGHGDIVTALLEHGSDATIMSEQNYTALDVATDFYHVDIVKILERHMVKIKAANLYAVNEAALSLAVRASSRDYEELCEFQNECEKETESTKSENVNANITFYDILTKDVSQLAMYARNESIVEAFGSGDYKEKFPIYASMINKNFRKGEKRKEFLEQGNKILDVLSNDFSELLCDCTEKIVT